MLVESVCLFSREHVMYAYLVSLDVAMAGDLQAMLHYATVLAYGIGIAINRYARRASTDTHTRAYA